VTRSSLDTLNYEVRGAGFWIVMTRPREMNSISPGLIADLNEVLSQAEADDQVRAIVLTGTDNAFCAGADLKFVHSLGGDAEKTVRLLHEPLAELLTRFKVSPKPIVAAVNGYCIAGGMETVLCCDLIIAGEEKAIFSDGHSKYGLLPAIGGAQGLTRALGPFKAKEMLFTADRYTARQMEAAGLVNWVVDDSELVRATQSIVDLLASRDPVGLHLMKKMVNDEWEMSWEAASCNELMITARYLKTSAPHEGVRAFIERRDPQVGAKPEASA
jgi:enoyl-CoA hydratase